MIPIPRRYPETPVYFLDASTELNIKSDLENILRSRGTAYASKDHRDTLTWLATKMENWLVIMDNADDPELRLFPLMPKCGHGNIIITTRNSILASLAPNSCWPDGGCEQGVGVAAHLPN